MRKEGDRDVSDEQYERGQEERGQCKKQRRRRNGQSKRENQNDES